MTAGSKTAPTLMVQGTASHAGKSTLVTAICRALRQDGYRVAPFKAQNMSLNSFITVDGLEVGRAQANQAAAAGVDLTVDMNPVLLKPQSNKRSQVVVLGKPLSALDAVDYYRQKPVLLPVVLGALDRLRAAYDAVIIEGAGSPAEINLRDVDIVNMRIAKAAGSPVVLTGDIDLGGVFAALIGTLMLLRPDERDLVSGFVINKFRGDVSLLQPGLDYLERTTGKPVLGVLPYVRDLGLAEEDGVALERPTAEQAAEELDGDRPINVAVIQLDHTSNFDDFDPLKLDPSFAVRFIRTIAELGAPDAIIVPGSKSTVADFQALRRSGLARAIVERRRAGATVFGICGGYQMLGSAIHDPHRVESPIEHTEGLDLLRVETTFSTEKATQRVHVTPAGPHPATVELDRLGFDGYEVHMGATVGPDATPPLLALTRQDGQTVPDGAASPDGRVVGLYVHGCFDDAAGRAWFRSLLPERRSPVRRFEGSMRDERERAYDRLAAILRANADWPAFRALLGI